MGLKKLLREAKNLAPGHIANKWHQYRSFLITMMYKKSNIW